VCIAADNSGGVGKWGWGAGAESETWNRLPIFAQVKKFSRKKVVWWFGGLVENKLGRPP